MIKIIKLYLNAKFLHLEVDNISTTFRRTQISGAVVFVFFFCVY
jgi:hypothetical protein